MGSVSPGVDGFATATALITLLASVAIPVVSRSAGAATFPAAASRPASLCTPAEIPLFACSVGSRRVAVCAAGRQATYRFGRPGRIELSSRALTTAMTGYAGGGETQITATNGTYSYTVFDRTTRTAFGTDGRHDAAFTSGVLVRRGGRTLSTLTCADDAPVSSRAQGLIPAGPFIRH